MKGTEVDFKAYIRRGTVDIKAQRERVARLLECPNEATADDVAYLCRKVQAHEQHMNELYIKGGLRPKHEWRDVTPEEMAQWENYYTALEQKILRGE